MSVSVASQSRARLSGPQRRQRILDAALEAFATGGYHATSVEEIAAGAATSKAVLYDHFSSKQQLMIELLQRIGAESFERVSDAAMSEGTHAERARAAVDAFFSYVAERPSAWRLLFTETPGEPEITRAHTTIQAKATKAIARLLRSEPDIGEGVRDRERALEAFAELIRSGCQGLAAWWYEHPEVPRAWLVDRAHELFWVGLRGSSNPVG